MVATGFFAQCYFMSQEKGLGRAQMLCYSTLVSWFVHTCATLLIADADFYYLMHVEQLSFLFIIKRGGIVSRNFFLALCKKTTIHQEPPCKPLLDHNHLLTPFTNDPLLAGTRAIIKVASHQYWWL